MNWNVYIVNADGQEAVIVDYDSRGRPRPAAWTSQQDAQHYADDCVTFKRWQSTRETVGPTFIIREEQPHE